MFLKHVRDIAKPQHFAIIDLLKRSTGMPVAELSRALNMSYMGVKQHCLDLEKKGWLDTWRRSVPNGRPEKLYRLTTKGGSLFPETGSDVMLEMLKNMAEIFGPSAPEKLLFSYFQKKTTQLEKKLKPGTAAEKAAQLVRLRSAEGHCSELEYDGAQGLSIVEWHNPHQAIAGAFASFHRLEEQMIQRLLGTTAHREEQRISGLTRILFQLPALSRTDIQTFLETPEGSRVKQPAAAPAALEPAEPEPADPTATAETEAVPTEPAGPQAPEYTLADSPPGDLPLLSATPRSLLPLSGETEDEPTTFARFTVQAELPEEVLSN
jgi:predicted ArsR family transcriptional regulator